MVGRKKGTPNKIPAALKDMILRALEEAGGVDYLVAQAHESPAAFLSLLGKVLPTRLQGDANNPLPLKIEVSYRKPELGAIEHQPNLMIE